MTCFRRSAIALLRIEDAREHRPDHVDAHVAVAARDRHLDLRLQVVGQALAEVGRAIRRGGVDLQERQRAERRADRRRDVDLDQARIESSRRRSSRCRARAPASALTVREDRQRAEPDAAQRRREPGRAAGDRRVGRRCRTFRCAGTCAFTDRLRHAPETPPSMVRLLFDGLVEVVVVGLLHRDVGEVVDAGARRQAERQVLAQAAAGSSCSAARLRGVPLTIASFSSSQ